MKQKPVISKKIQKTLSDCGIEFARIFGSYVQSPSRSRDVDIFLGMDFSHRLKLDQVSLLNSEFEKFFKKPVDLVLTQKDMNPTLVREIVKNSIRIWERPKSGEIAFVNWVDRALAIAEDELLSNPIQDRIKALDRPQRRARES